MASKGELDGLRPSSRFVGPHLDAISGMGPTRVSKLLARKRPRLIPILDERVREFFRHQTGRFWVPLAHALTDENRRNRIEALRPQGAGRLSLLRILDIAIWMSMRVGPPG